MTIRTRVNKLNAIDLPFTWHNRLEGLNPNNLIYISTNKPAEQMSIAELEKLIEDKRANAIIEEATTQLFEAIDILKGFGADIDINVIGIKRPDLEIEN
jgi:Fe-S cluster assembly scaffold protein SufB